MNIAVTGGSNLESNGIDDRIAVSRTMAQYATVRNNLFIFPAAYEYRFVAIKYLETRNIAVHIIFGSNRLTKKLFGYIIHRHGKTVYVKNG